MKLKFAKMIDISAIDPRDGFFGGKFLKIFEKFLVSFQF